MLKYHCIRGAVTVTPFSAAAWRISERFSGEGDVIA
jgi:hypothetical protein